MGSTRCTVHCILSTNNACIHNQLNARVDFKESTSLAKYLLLAVQRKSKVVLSVTPHPTVLKREVLGCEISADIEDASCLCVNFMYIYQVLLASCFFICSPSISNSDITHNLSDVSHVIRGTERS